MAADITTPALEIGTNAGIIGGICMVIAALVQNVVYALKSKNEMKRQDRLDRWERLDLKGKLKLLNEELDRARTRIQELEKLIVTHGREQPKP